jgi:hypothetical protein
MKTLVVFEQFPEKTRLFALAPDSEHVNAALVAAGDAPSIEAMEQFAKLVEHGQLDEISDDGSGVIYGHKFDAVIMVSCDG